MGEAEDEAGDVEDADLGVERVVEDEAVAVADEREEEDAAGDVHGAAPSHHRVLNSMGAVFIPVSDRSANT